MSKLRSIAVIASLLVSIPALALPALRDDITIYDGDSKNADGWYGMQEDQEVEPGMQTNQGWDMEGFFLETGTSNLGFITGYDGGDHNAAYGFDLSFLAVLGFDEYWVSTTMGCGNDHLMGYVGGGSMDVPEPSSLALMALAPAHTEKSPT